MCKSDDDIPLSVSSLAPVEDVLWVYKVSHMYYGLIAMAIAFIVGIVVSLITGYLISSIVCRFILFQFRQIGSCSPEA